MTSATLDKLETAYRAHGDYVLGVLARRSPFIRPVDRQGVYHDAFTLVLEKAGSGRLDVDGMNARQLRAYLAKTAVLIALDQVRWGERAHTRPLTDVDIERANGEQPPEERVAAGSELAVLREIVAELPERRRAVVKLRYFFDREPKEVQLMLGISARTYRLEIERALRHIAQRYQVAREGRWCDDRRSLILAYVAGIAGPRKAVEARLHLQACRACAQMAAELRLAARKVAAVAPLPELALQDGTLARMAEGLAVARDQLADLGGQAKQHAFSLVARTDPTASGNYLAGTRPGAMAATVASCVAIGGGAATYCAAEGLPDPIRPVFGVERPEARAKQEPSTATEQPASPAPVTQAPPSESGPPQPASVPSAPQAPPPEPEPRSDFDFEKSTPAASSASQRGRESAGSVGGPEPATPAPAGPGSEFGP